MNIYLPIAGQSVKTALQIGFSLGQIGEFSFIIAQLGVASAVVPARPYKPRDKAKLQALLKESDEPSVTREIEGRAFHEGRERHVRVRVFKIR